MLILQLFHMAGWEAGAHSSSLYSSWKKRSSNFFELLPTAQRMRKSPAVPPGGQILRGFLMRLGRTIRFFGSASPSRLGTQGRSPKRSKILRGPSFGTMANVSSVIMEIFATRWVANGSAKIAKKSGERGQVNLPKPFSNCAVRPPFSLCLLNKGIGLFYWINHLYNYRVTIR